MLIRFNSVVHIMYLNCTIKYSQIRLTIGRTIQPAEPGPNSGESISNLTEVLFDLI